MKLALLLLSMLAICHAEQPNIVLFVVDDGNEYDESPFVMLFCLSFLHIAIIARSPSVFAWPRVFHLSHCKYVVV
jgi:hypothetical protein